jgi:hypothetical protein
MIGSYKKNQGITELLDRHEVPVSHDTKYRRTLQGEESHKFFKGSCFFLTSGPIFKKVSQNPI